MPRMDISPASDDGSFARCLMAWHAQHGRHDLPWQNTRDPYRIWLSEIMLQQTQVEAVIPYYARFLARFPDLASLAAAATDEVMALWSGLGYYARARNLHKAAQAVMQVHGGVFPRSAEEIATLPGIGRSTAAAIAAFAFGERAAILDGNVKRVLCRVFAIEGFPGEKVVENRLWALAEALLPEQGVDIYIQAQMDLGATLCTRGRPACGRCPLAQRCGALAAGKVASLPTPRPRKAVPHRSQRVMVIVAAGRVLLERRPAAGIWGGLLSLPELGEAESPAVWLHARLGLREDTVQVQALAPEPHAFTHFTLDLQPLRVDLEIQPQRVCEAEVVWQSLEQLADAALPAPIRRILSRGAEPEQARLAF